MNIVKTEIKLLLLYLTFKAFSGIIPIKTLSQITGNWCVCVCVCLCACVREGACVELP